MGLAEDSVGFAEAAGLLLGEALGDADGFAADKAGELELVVVVVVVGVQATEARDRVAAIAKLYDIDLLKNFTES